MSRIAIVTGAGTGVGRATALALLREGYVVLLAGRRAELLDAVAREAATDRAVPVPTDVTDPERVQALFETARTRFGRLDLLFNNAGVSLPGVPLEEITLEQWRRVIDINLTGPFLCTREAFRLMKSQSPRGGRIINNGSISAHVPRPNSSPYTASKHAITGLTKASALDGRAFDIAVGQIDIGNADTQMAQGQKKGILQADGDVRMEPMMDVEHVARSVVHMASLPLDANVLFMTVMATKMPYVGRG
jgi:NAD(P)-dependent dehydrogenase (short-subunit alcohol dehydrogenase family)